MIKLTAKQRKTLNFIRSHIAEHHVPPTHAEIAAVLGTTYKKGVSNHLTALERKGYVKRLPNRHRGIRLVGAQTSHSVTLDRDIFSQLRQYAAASKLNIPEAVGDLLRRVA